MRNLKFIMTVLSAQMAYFGDTGVDMQTASRAGMFAVGVNWGFREPDELLQNDA